MTANTPQTGLRVRASRAIRGVFVFAAAVSLAASAGLVAGSPASAADDNQTDEADAGLVELYLSPGSHGVIGVDEALNSTITVINGTDDELTAGRISLELNRTPLADSAELSSWLDDGTAPSGSFDAIAIENSTPIAGNTTSASPVFVSATDLGALPAGVYPIRASLSGVTTGDIQDETLTSRNATATSVLVVTSAERPQVSVVVPITATPEDGFLLTAAELIALTAADGALSAQLDGVGGTPAVLAVDPAIPASIRALGTSAPLTAVDWLTRLEALPNERFALQFGDADAAVQAQAELPELLTPPALTPYLDPANFVPVPTGTTPTPTPTPTGTQAPLEPELPDNAELTEIRGAVSGILWPLGDVTGSNLTTFSSYLDGGVTTIVPSTSVSEHGSARGDVDGNSILISNAEASAALSLAASEPDQYTRDRELAAGLGHLALAGVAGSQIVGLDRDETRTATALREAISAVAAAAQPTDLTVLQAEAAVPVTLDAEATDTRTAKLNGLLAEESALREFASILDDPLLLMTPNRVRVMRVISVGGADACDDAVAAHHALTADTLDSVGIQQPSPVQLFTSAAPLPVWVRNDLPWPVNVRLSAHPSDARLDVQPVTEVPAQPASNTRVKVPVEARVGSGELSVRFSLTSPTGVPIGGDQTAQVTVRAEWEGIGLISLGGVIVLLLAIGVWRTVRRRKRDAVQSDEAGESDAEPAASASEGISDRTVDE